jgi:hypothetical protein
MMFLAEDHRNSSMNLGDEIVGLSGYDCTGADVGIPLSTSAFSEGFTKFPDLEFLATA